MASLGICIVEIVGILRGIEVSFDPFMYTICAAIDAASLSFIVYQLVNSGGC